MDIVRQKKRLMLTLAALCVCGKVYGTAPNVQVIPFPNGAGASNIHGALRSIDIRALDEFKRGEDKKEVLLVKRLLKVMLVLPIEDLPEDIQNKSSVQDRKNQLFMPQGPDKKCINAWALLSTLPEEYPGTEPEGWESMIKDLNKVLIDGLIYIKREGINSFDSAELNNLLGTYSTFIAEKDKNIKGLKELVDGSKWSSSLDQATSAYNKMALKNSISTFTDMVPLMLPLSVGNDSSSGYRTYHLFGIFIVGFVIGVIGGVLSSDHDEELQGKKKSKRKKKDAENGVEKKKE